MVNMDFTSNDFNSVNNYIKKRQTAILVIMFTDLVGYTKLTEDKGEEYVATLIEHHNDILTETIEANESGKVIKYIGDSVMAIFSEPTKAVEIAQSIHKKLNEFNNTYTDLEDIYVRIGLHMGQVAVENKLEGDILGRHVNRASRIEGLAGAGQTYISYSVFDSAKGWLQGNISLGWKYHGDYLLKGIDKPAEIYQVYNSDLEKPKAPVKGKKKRKFPSWIFLILFLTVGAGITLGLVQYQKTEVYLFDFNVDYAMLGEEDLFLDGNDGDHKRLILNDLKKGINIINYDVSPYLRYYIKLDIERGLNLINPEYKESRTPFFNFITSIDDGLLITESKEINFTYYDANNNLVSELVTCNITIKKTIEDNIINYHSSWVILKDNVFYKEGISETTQDIDSNQSNYGDWIDYQKDNVYFVRSKVDSREQRYEIEIMFGWY